MYNPRVLDFFCDASLDVGKRGACGGVIGIERNTGRELFRRAIIQPQGTNNTGEIGAILLAIDIFCQLWYYDKNIIMNIYSDSMLCINALRKWIINWIGNSDGNTLIKNTGEAVLNQNYYKMIYNKILAYKMPISFYHVKGHSLGDLTVTSRAFKQFNEVDIEDVHLSASYIAYYNDQVDTWSRQLLRRYMNQSIIDASAVIECLYTYPNDVVPLYRLGSKLGNLDSYKRLISSRKIYHVPVDNLSSDILSGRIGPNIATKG